ncbi:MAG: glycoside hydrolase family 3 N-terminal domain-containing protein, partial [Propionicimonas sp.]
ASTAPESQAPTCRATAEGLSLREQAGQLLMVGLSGTLDAAERTAITKYHVGSVILMGTSTAGVKRTAALTGQLAKLGGETGILVAVDQEGGLVQRLQGPGFSTIPSAAKQAKLSDATLRRRAERWGEELAAAGVHLNLAPVADVVPAAKQATNQPVARLGRGYGSKPAVVSAKVDAVVTGLRAGGVSAAVKHFPGLGEVTGNTDFVARVVDTVTTATSPGLVPFHDAVTAGVDAVMVSSAFYARIDGKRMASSSPKVIGLLREWGFEGVVVSDDLGAAVALRSVPATRRALSFIEAGGDLAITATPGLAASMTAGLVKAAKADSAVAGRITEAASRVLALKQAHGLVDCG